MHTIKIFVVMVICTITKSYTQNHEIIPISDPNFKNYLLQSSVNRNGDSEIDKEEANNFVSLDIANLQIRSLDGIQEFANLKHLDFSGNQVRILDLSRNQKLETLVADNNALVYLEVGHNVRLEHLSCHGNQLRLLRLPNTDRLEYIKASDNLLTNLDITQLPELRRLHIANNNLVGLDTNNNTKLTEVLCGHNRIVTLNLGSNPNLEKLDCEYNKIEALDIRQNSKLKVLDCENNELQSLKIYYLGGQGAALQALNATSNRLLYQIYTNDLEDALEGRSRRFLLLDSHTNFVEYPSQRNTNSKEVERSVMTEIVAAISTNHMHYKTNTELVPITVQIYGMDGNLRVKRRHIMPGSTYYFETLSPGIYVVVYSVEGKKISRVTVLDSKERQQQVSVNKFKS